MTSPNNDQVDNTASTSSSAGEVDSPFPPTQLRSGNPLLYRLILGAFFVLSVFLIIYALNMGIGTLQQPASGLWIFIVAGAILISLPGAWLVNEQFEVFNRERVSRAVIMVGSLFLFVVLFPLLGFIAGGAVSLYLITRYSAEESVRVSLILAVVTPVVLYLLFGVAFSVPLNPLPGWL